MTAFFFYFKIIVVIEMKKKLINPLKIGKNLKRCVDQMGYKVKDMNELIEEDERKGWGYRIYQMKEGKMTLENQEIL